MPGTFAAPGPLKKLYRMAEKTALRQESFLGPSIALKGGLAALGPPDTTPGTATTTAVVKTTAVTVKTAALSPSSGTGGGEGAHQSNADLRVQFRYGRVCDVRRGFIQARTMAQMVQVVQGLQQAEANAHISIVRIKDRFSRPSAGGWADAMLNFYFTDDPSRHICEVQVVHEHLMTARAGLGGHGIYGKGRSAAELLELAVKAAPDGAWRDAISLLCFRAHVVANGLELSQEFKLAGRWDSWVCRMSMHCKYCWNQHASLYPLTVSLTVSLSSL